MGELHADDLMEWAAAGRPLDGELVSGDGCHVVRGDGVVVAVVIDGLGHGLAAHRATKAVQERMGQLGPRPLPELFQACHQAAASTRGVAMSGMRLTAQGRLSWLGVGNVDAVRTCFGGAERPNRERLLVLGGVVGGRLPRRLVAREQQLAAGDLLVMATDGLVSAWTDDLSLDSPSMEPDRIAERLLGHYGRSSDDALVWAGRYRGPRG